MRPRKQQRTLPSCVYFRHGAFWFVKRGKWTRLAADLGEALNEYARIHDPKGGLDKWVDEALEAHRKGKKVAPSTFKQYGHAAKNMKLAFAEFAPDQVRQKHIYQWKRAMAETPNMANRCLTVARIVFGYLAEQQIVDGNPAIGVPPYEESKRERLLTSAEFSAIRDKAVPRLQSMMDLMFLTGQRLMDVVSIHEADIKPEGLYFQQDKTGTRLTVRWTPELRAAVDRARALNKVRSLTLFRGRRGTPPKYRSVYVQWVDACRLAGVVGAQARDVRAQSATEAQAQGINATKLLGHASEAMTKRYLRGKVVPLVDGPSIGQALDVGQTGQEKQ